jgi:hypothetical protein
LASAIDQVQAVSDGGSFPDSEGVPSPTEVEIKTIVTDLQTVDSLLKTQWPRLLAGQVETLKVDPVRAVFALRSEGRRLVTRLSRLLNIRPRADVFSSTSPNTDPRGGIPWIDGGQH